MKDAKAVKFAKMWSKLTQEFFVTVRWTDTNYHIGTDLPIIIRGIEIMWCKPIFAVLVKLQDLLNEDFTRYDADCNPDEYFDMMKKWYSKKPDWKGSDNIVQIIGCVKM